MGRAGCALPVPVSLKVPAAVTAGSWWGAWEEAADGGGKLRGERGALAELASGAFRELPHLLPEEDGECCARLWCGCLTLWSCSQGMQIPAHIPLSCVPNLSPTCPQHVPPACPPQSHTGQGLDKCFLSHTLLIRKMTPGNCPVGNCRSCGSMRGWGQITTGWGHTGDLSPCPRPLCHLVCSPLLGSDVLWGHWGGWDRRPQPRSCHCATSRAGCC